MAATSERTLSTSSSLTAGMAPIVPAALATDQHVTDVHNSERINDAHSSGSRNGTMCSQSA